MTALLPLSLLLRALEQIARGERTEAWRAVRRASAAAPRDGLVRVLASRLLYLLGDYRAALDESWAAMELSVESAAMLGYEQAREIGWYHGACTALETVLRAGADACAPHPESAQRPPERRFDRALEHLVQLYVDHEHDEAAAATLDRYLPLTRGSLFIHLQAARVYDRRGETEKTLAAIRSALATAPPTSITWLEAAPVLLELGAFDDAGAIFQALLEDDAAAPSALEALGRLCLWTGNLEAAVAYAERLGSRQTKQRAGARMRAALLVLRGDYAAALTILDAVLRDDPNDGEAYLWRAEANLRMGRREETCSDADRSLAQGYSFAACAIRMLGVLIPPGDHDDANDAPPSGVVVALSRRLARWRSGVPSRMPPVVDGGLLSAREELRAELTEMFADAPTLLAQNSTDGLAALLERSLVAMRGNRTPLGTWMKPEGRLARLPRTTSPRITSRMALELLRVAPVEVCFRRLDQLAARFPDSSMPLVHRGELQLWLGRYAEARADLEAAIAIRRQTRWAWFGLAWLDLIEGDPERSLATCARGIEVMDNTEGPVAFICRGEAYRLLGRLDEARDQLQRSCTLNPTRLSAWINLALVHAAAGDRTAQRVIYRRLAEVAPAFLSEAAFALGEEVFKTLVLEGPAAFDGPGAAAAFDLVDRVLVHSLTMMRGNRASGLITYFTNDGQLRHVPRYSGGGSVGTDAEARTLAQVRGVLTRALESRRA